jgi:hypothetical protein
MKRFIAALTLLAAVAGFGTQAFAQAQVDPSKNELTRFDAYSTAP